MNEENTFRHQSWQLWNVNNTSDLDKPVSNATASALSGNINCSSVTTTGSIACGDDLTITNSLNCNDVNCGPITSGSIECGNIDCGAIEMAGNSVVYFDMKTVSSNPDYGARLLINDTSVNPGNGYRSELNIDADVLQVSCNLKCSKAVVSNQQTIFSDIATWTPLVGAGTLFIGPNARVTTTINLRNLCTVGNTFTIVNANQSEDFNISITGPNPEGINVVMGGFVTVIAGAIVTMRVLKTGDSPEVFTCTKIGWEIYVTP